MMRLRNIFRIKDKQLTLEQMRNFIDTINKGDTIVSAADYEYEKIPLSVEDLINRNMDLIEELLKRKKEE